MVDNYTALYGVFDTNLKPDKVINVSDALTHFIHEGVLVLSKEKDLDDLFPNRFTGKKFLQIQLPDGGKINILNDTYLFDIRINLLSSHKQISIVYSVFINPLSNWRAIVGGQLAELRSYGLLDEADLYICITDPYKISGVSNFIKRASSHKATLIWSSANQFEYPAINLLHSLAIQQPGKVYMYLHTKAMSRNIKKRSKDEQVLLAQTFGNWRKSIEAFQDATVNKIGLFPAIDTPSQGGWIWYNFFIARGSYLAGCEVPEPSANRYYYESWIAKHNGVIVIDDCYSVLTNRKENFSQQAAVDVLIKMLTGINRTWSDKIVSLPSLIVTLYSRAIWKRKISGRQKP